MSRIGVEIYWGCKISKEVASSIRKAQENKIYLQTFQDELFEKIKEKENQQHIRQACTEHNHFNDVKISIIKQALQWYLKLSWMEKQNSFPKSDMWNCFKML